MCPYPPPWVDIRQPTINTSLLDPEVNKQTLPTILKSCALETINHYPSSATHIYTDGSAFKATKLAGYGVFVRYPDESEETLVEITVPTMKQNSWPLQQVWNCSIKNLS